MALFVAMVALAVAVAAAARFLLALLEFRRLELALPGPPSLPLLGNALAMLGVSEDTVLSMVVDRLWGGLCSELSRASAFGHLAVFVTDPDHLRELFARKELIHKDHFLYRFFEPMGYGLVSHGGEKWRAHRRALQPAFHQSVLDRYTAVFSAEALGFARRVRPGEAQAVADNLQSLMARAFLRTAIGSEKAAAEVGRALPLFKEFLATGTRSFSRRCMQPWLWPGWAFALTPSGRALRRLRRGVHAFFRAALDDRRAELEGRQPPLAGLSGPAARRPTALLDVLLEPGGQPSLSSDEILDEAVVFTGAAIETTVSTLGWALKALSLRQDVQERLLRELEEVFGEATPPARITPADLSRLEYTERVIKETLRLLPAVPFIGREVRQRTEFCGRTLPAGTSLIVNVLGAHRHPGHWPDPLRFDPDRFLPERSQGRHPYAYLPFSAGPRNCIGGRYAMMVMKTLLATLVPRYRVDPVDGEDYKEPADLPMTFGLASRMVGGVRVVFTPRATFAA